MLYLLNSTEIFHVANKKIKLNLSEALNAIISVRKNRFPSDVNLADLKENIGKELLIEKQINSQLRYKFHYEKENKKSSDDLKIKVFKQLDIEIARILEGRKKFNESFFDYTKNTKYTFLPASKSRKALAGELYKELCEIARELKKESVEFEIISQKVNLLMNKVNDIARRYEVVKKKQGGILEETIIQVRRLAESFDRVLQTIPEASVLNRKITKA